MLGFFELLERSDILAAMGELKLFGMAGAALLAQQCLGRARGLGHGNPGQGAGEHGDGTGDTQHGVSPVVHWLTMKLMKLPFSCSVQGGRARCRNSVRTIAPPRPPCARRAVL